MLMRRKPASKSAWAWSASRMPLVVRPTSRMPGMAAQHPHQPRQVAAHQRLAAGQANLVDAQRGGDADEARDLLEGQQLAAVHET